MERLPIEFCIRTALIAAATGTALWLLRIRTAAARHAAWSGVMLAMLLLPAWIAWGPKASLPVLPQVLPQPRTLAAVDASASPEQAPLQAAAAPLAPVWNWSAVLAGVYLLGAAVLLLRLAIGTILANRLTGVACAAPVTVGLLRPRIILPECWSEWPEALLDAVLTHEREHVRRRDPLLHWLALFNRAVFWFHPLAWWLERRIAALAEEACDATVLARGCDPAEYSGYLLDLARSVERAGKRVNAVAAVAMGMPGSALPRRLRNIAAGVPAPRISRARLACAALACAIPAVVFAAGTLDRVPRILPLPAWPVPQPPALLAQAQAAPAPPAQAAKLAFETATVMPATGTLFQAIGGPGAGDPGQIAYTNISMHQLLTTAYGLTQPYLLLGLSTIEENSRYDIAAKIPPGTTKEQLSAMVQNLLVERFNLKVHREPRSRPEYELVVAPGGVKMKETSGPVPISAGIIFYPASSPASNGWRIANRAVSTATIAAVCYNFVHRQVADHTGLNGNYDVNLDFMRDDFIRDGPAAISTAMEQQLGLRLEPIDVPVDVLVIDHIDPVPARN